MPAPQGTSPAAATYIPHIRLELLDERHAADLYRHGQEASLWEYLSSMPFQDYIEARDWIREARKAYDAGRRIPYAIIHAATGKAIGSTSLAQLNPRHKRLEIGHTWIGKAFHGQGVNTESKYLLLQHAFHSLLANRVEFKTDSRNLRSQSALESIGAQREGLLRAHMVMPDGYVRDSVIYSVTISDWAIVRPRILARLHAQRMADGEVKTPAPDRLPDFEVPA